MKIWAMKSSIMRMIRNFLHLKNRKLLILICITIQQKALFSRMSRMMLKVFLSKNKMILKWKTGSHYSMMEYIKALLNKRLKNMRREKRVRNRGFKSNTRLLVIIMTMMITSLQLFRTLWRILKYNRINQVIKTSTNTDQLNITILLTNPLIKGMNT